MADKRQQGPPRFHPRRGRGKVERQPREIGSVAHWNISVVVELAFVGTKQCVADQVVR